MLDRRTFLTAIAALPLASPLLASDDKKTLNDFRLKIHLADGTEFWGPKCDHVDISCDSKSMGKTNLLDMNWSSVQWWFLPVPVSDLSGVSGLTLRLPDGSPLLKYSDITPTDPETKHRQFIVALKNPGFIPEPFTFMDDGVLTGCKHVSEFTVNIKPRSLPTMGAQ